MKSKKREKFARVVKTDVATWELLAGIPCKFCICEEKGKGSLRSLRALCSSLNLLFDRAVDHIEGRPAKLTGNITDI